MILAGRFSVLISSSKKQPGLIFWRKHILQTDEADPQWRQAMRILGVDVAFALSPEAKGKIERPYRWVQDRIVRTCAIES